MPEGERTTIAVLTDLWPSRSEPLNGIFVQTQVERLADRYRHLVLVPRLLAGSLHRLVWSPPPNGLQRGWSEPSRGRVLRYPYVRIPKLGEAEARAAGARAVLAGARERPSLVHAHFLHETGVAGVRLARSLGVPAVVTVHGTDARWLLEGGIQERFRRRMLEAARLADRVIAVSDGIADGLVAAGVARDRVLVLPMGVDERLFRSSPRAAARAELGLDPSRRLVVFVGRATADKGIGELAAAAAALAGDADVVVVGPADAGRLHGLRYAGAEPPERVATWLAAADVFCLPSWAEGTPVSVAEALASGRPVVATRVGGIPRQVGESAGLLVEARDAGGLTAALREALAREWDVDTIREASRPFWLSETLPRLDVLYTELLAR